MTFISRCWEDGEAIPTSNIFAHPRATCKTFQSSSQCLVRHQKNFFFLFNHFSLHITIIGYIVIAPVTQNERSKDYLDNTL